MRYHAAERYMVIGVYIKIVLMFAHAQCMFYYFQHACGRHRILVTPEILIKIKIVFFFFFFFFFCIRKSDI